MSFCVMQFIENPLFFCLSFKLSYGKMISIAWTTIIIKNCIFMARYDSDTHVQMKLFN